MRRRRKSTEEEGGRGAEADGLVPLVGCFLLFTRQMARYAPHHIKHMLRANAKAGGGEVCGGGEWVLPLRLAPHGSRHFSFCVSPSSGSVHRWISEACQRAPGRQEEAASRTRTYARTHTGGIDADLKQFY